MKVLSIISEVLRSVKLTERGTELVIVVTFHEVLRWKENRD